MNGPGAAFSLVTVNGPGGPVSTTADGGGNVGFVVQSGSCTSLSAAAPPTATWSATWSGGASSGMGDLASFTLLAGGTTTVTYTWA